MPVLRAVHHDPVPPVLLDADLRAGHPLEGVREVPAQAQGERLDLAHPVLLGEGVDGVLLGVGRHDVGVVTLQVRGGEVAAQRGRHVQVLDLVPVAVAVDVHQADLRLAVLVLAERDGHHELPPYLWSLSKSLSSPAAAMRRSSVRSSQQRELHEHLPSNPTTPSLPAAPTTRAPGNYRVQLLPATTGSNCTTILRTAARPRCEPPERRRPERRGQPPRGRADRPRCGRRRGAALERGAAAAAPTEAAQAPCRRPARSLD